MSSSSSSQNERKVDAIAGLDTASELPKDVVLQTSDGKSIKIARNYVTISKLLKALCCEDEFASVVHLNQKSEQLAPVVEYLKHHRGAAPKLIPQPLRSQYLHHVCPDKWDAKFIDSACPGITELKDLLLVANYLGIVPLVDLAVAKLVSVCKTKSPAQTELIMSGIVPFEKVTAESVHELLPADAQLHTDHVQSKSKRFVLKQSSMTSVAGQSSSSSSSNSQPVTMEDVIPDDLLVIEDDEDND